MTLNVEVAQIKRRLRHERVEFVSSPRLTTRDGVQALIRQGAQLADGTELVDFELAILPRQ